MTNGRQRREDRRFREKGKKLSLGGRGHLGGVSLLFTYLEDSGERRTRFRPRQLSYYIEIAVIFIYIIKNARF